MALQAMAEAILVTEVIREVMDFPTCSDRHRSWAQKYLARWIKWYSSTRYWSRWSLLWESRHLKSGKVSFFLGHKKKKSYVLGMDPFDEVYKGDCLTFRGQNASFPRYDNFFANFCQKVPHFEGL